ncbi:DUF2141 domain-containing protein [Rugamonas rubra]|uniref:Uncharacterized conserved protein, DUF2141 family n=1 Tax=Rugamonas rubra TaxID=758825 RepID=A0A1I4PFG0_9BURK|nr:DUF2141 domain-containing protein [Rugamonas rubra]SFM26256.1 Uncharacterized conserved protein, DUF2141 family [Rugamonas rubra]
MTTLTTATLYGALLLACATAGAADLTIRVDAVKSADGKLMVAIYDNAATFLRKPRSDLVVAPVTGSNTVLVKDLPPGDYAIAVFHDENGNGKMDANAFGIPTERIGFSNDARGNMGPPGFDSARLSLPVGGASIQFSLH